ncbi:unnamed protein product, partial [Prorocentrum cordatum]
MYDRAMAGFCNSSALLRRWCGSCGAERCCATGFCQGLPVARDFEPSPTRCCGAVGVVGNRGTRPPRPPDVAISSQSRPPELWTPSPGPVLPPASFLDGPEAWRGPSEAEHGERPPVVIRRPRREEVRGERAGPQRLSRGAAGRRGRAQAGRGSIAARSSRRRAALAARRRAEGGAAPASAAAEVGAE